MNFFSQLIGQNQAVELLTQTIRQNRIAPAYLFAGSKGVGRSLAARCFIQQMFCANVPDEKQQRLQLDNHPDVLWVEPTYLHQGQRLSASLATEKGLKRSSAPIIRTEQIREIAQFLSRPPLVASRSVVVIESAETMVEAAANALLKTLEEPGQATLILIAPSTESLLTTLVSRCQRIPFYRLNLDGMTQVLRQSGHEEILQHPEILATSQGSPGVAIVAWEQLQEISPELLNNLSQLPKSLTDALELARQIDKTLDKETQLWLVDYLQQSYWQQFLAGAIKRLPLEQLEKARRHLLTYAQPRLVWEVTLLELHKSYGQKIS